MKPKVKLRVSRSSWSVAITLTLTWPSEQVELADLPSDDSDGESWGAQPPSDDEGDDDELGVAERHRTDATLLVEDAMRPGVQSKQQHRVFLEREKGLLELFSTRKAKKILKGGTTETVLTRRFQ